MAKDAWPWTMEEMIDFENEVAAATQTPPEVREAVLTSIRGLDGVAARRVGFRTWLLGVRSASPGRSFTSALAIVGAGLALLMFLTGVSGVLGMVDHEKSGVHVTLFLALLIGGQWLVLIAAAVAWLMRRKAAEGFSLVQSVVGKIVVRIAAGHEAPWWGRMMESGGTARMVLLWRIARMVQAAGISFNMGILAGLAGLVLVRHVGFYWETTTEMAMHSLLEKLARILSIPWAAWFPGAVPGAAVIDASRWLPGHALQPGPAAWWRFLLMTTLCWGLLPRLVLWVLAWRAGSKALANLDFLSRQHRALWRDLTGSGRLETPDKPLDGVLVLDVGGSGFSEQALRPFLLRRLRVHVAAWHSVAVLDSGKEAQAAKALTAAPAGVVLLAEGWALSPARMSGLLASIRASGGPGVPVKFLIANCGPEHLPQPPLADERREWERFTDSLRDPETEVFFFESAQDGE